MTMRDRSALWHDRHLQDSSRCYSRVSSTAARGARAWLVGGSLSSVLALPLVCAAQPCPGSDDDIATDRPDVTNSSLVVPFDSLQLENGVNWTRGLGTDALDGTNTRMRFGLGSCTEILVDLPDFIETYSGRGPTGFSAMSPGIKHQIDWLPEEMSLSAVAGVATPGAARSVSRDGFAPYLQFPWSVEVADKWSVNGMLTVYWPSNRTPGAAKSEGTVSLERELDPRSDLFAEFISDEHSGATASHSFNFGGSYRTTRTQQFDFHLGFGVGSNFAARFVGLGYSLRFDDLF